MPLPRRFYLRPARAVARDLLGCVLVARRGPTLTAGRIVETEAYLGPEDEASHAAFRPGSRALFYGAGGYAYVYLNYGMHHCLNAIAGRAARPGCVLIRALEPVAGLGAMARRRGVAQDARRLASGPGNLTRALAITARDNRILDAHALAAKREPALHHIHHDAPRARHLHELDRREANRPGTDNEHILARLDCAAVDGVAFQIASRAWR